MCEGVADLCNGSGIIDDLNEPSLGSGSHAAIGDET